MVLAVAAVAAAEWRRCRSAEDSREPVPATMPGWRAIGGLEVAEARGPGRLGRALAGRAGCKYGERGAWRWCWCCCGAECRAAAAAAAAAAAEGLALSCRGRLPEY